MEKEDAKFKFNNTLLIDDNYLDNFINQKMIESTGFSKNIIVATDGVNALDTINNLIAANGKMSEPLIDVMFVDLNMPIMGGFEFLERLKKINNEKLTHCRMVILTSSINIKDREYAENLDPAIIFINKPLTDKFLINF